MGKIEKGIRLPLTVLRSDFHNRVEAALGQGRCIDLKAEDGSFSNIHVLSETWPSRDILLEGHLFDSGLINQALEIIEKRNGDFEIISVSARPNDQMTNADFNFRRQSSMVVKVYAVDNTALDDIIGRIESLVEVMESAEGVLTVVN